MLVLLWNCREGFFQVINFSLLLILIRNANQIIYNLTTIAHLMTVDPLFPY